MLTWVMARVVKSLEWVPLSSRCVRDELLLRGVRHVSGLRRNLISLGLLHAATDMRTLGVMQGGKTIMLGEKSSAQQYKLKGSVVEALKVES